MKALLILLTVFFIMSACSEKETIVQEEAKAKATEDIRQDEKEQQEFVECVGEIRVPPSSAISLHSPMSGILKLRNLHEGMRVKKGQVLATLHDVEIIRIQENYLKSKYQLSYRTAEFERKKELLEGNAIPKREFQEAEAAYLAEKINYKSLQQQIALLGVNEKNLVKGEIVGALSIVSPIEGFVTEILVNNGMYIGQDVALIKIIGEEEKHVVMQVFSDDIGRIEEGQKIIFQYTGSDKMYESKVQFIGKSVDAETNTVHVHGELNVEKDGFIVGSKVFGKIEL